MSSSASSVARAASSSSTTFARPASMHLGPYGARLCPRRARPRSTRASSSPSPSEFAKSPGGSCFFFPSAPGRSSLHQQIGKCLSRSEYGLNGLNQTNQTKQTIPDTSDAKAELGRVRQTGSDYPDGAQTPQTVLRQLKRAGLAQKFADLRMYLKVAP
jgi:hypothetical protein